ncbi:unnamed protein product [Lupinus luteus]|uniref:Uncharacterized protein n=1 Tax=Lupinus luteus TaxID=3873 RepID=A0AAV1WKC1_LUPLU
MTRLPRNASDEAKGVLTVSDVLFGNQPSRSARNASDSVCGASDTEDLPVNFRKLAKDTYTPNIIVACDCMLG